jgi:AraC-like DNA-binding protein
VFSLVGHTTVRAYIRRARMRRAAALVLATDAPLAAVAAQVGYGHVSAFVKAFRVHHGMPPAELRRRCSESADFGLDRLPGDPAGRPSR